MEKKNGGKKRELQKLQTRFKILTAARELMHRDERISLEDIAEKAGISRATMYRYFSNIDLLFAEATLDTHSKHPEILKEEVKGKQMSNRIFHIQDYYNSIIIAKETAYRRYLSAAISESVTAGQHLRGARRVKALTLALASYKKNLGEDTFKKLIHSASLLMGIESVITTRDVCKLNEEESLETLRWAMEMLLKGVEHDRMEKAGPSLKPKKPSQ